MGREDHKIDTFSGHHKCKTSNFLIFYDVQISRVKIKISIKCAYKERGSKLMVVRVHMSLSD